MSTPAAPAPHRFRCETCGKVFEAGESARMIGGTIYCDPCYAKVKP